MNKNKVFGIIYMIFGLFLAISPHKIFPVCEKMEKVMKCHWTAQAELGIGLLIFALGVLLIIFKSKETQTALSLVGFISGILALLFPTVLIGGCMKPEMACRTHAFPAIYAISVLLIIISVVHIMYLRKQKDI